MSQDFDFGLVSSDFGFHLGRKTELRVVGTFTMETEFRMHFTTIQTSFTFHYTCIRMPSSILDALTPIGIDAARETASGSGFIRSVDPITDTD